jgi:hypothetical protein
MRKPDSIKIGDVTLQEIIDRHQHWFKNDCDGLEYMCVDLSYADLSYADLNYTDLSYANLCGANLSYANLSYADLSYADLNYTDLCGANLSYANLSYADLSYADLNYTDLSYAILCDANLYGARGKLIEYRKGKILRESIIGYKKCRDDVIVTLEIPRGAIVFSINGNMCRTNKAKVINIDGADRAYSIYNNMSYYVGDEFTIYNFNCIYNTGGATGIHFFMTRTEAENYL